MRLVKLNEIFEVKYGVNLDKNKLTIVNKKQEDSIPYVGRGSFNNGISDYVLQIEDQPTNKVPSLSVAAGGSVLSTFFHEKEYYSGRDVYILTPKNEMNISAFLFYIKIIEKNKYRYSYGRQANKTLESIMIPHPEDLPSYVFEEKEFNYEESNLSYIEQRKLEKDPLLALYDKEWKYFTYEEVFKIKRGTEGKRTEKEGNIPFISATEKNNGILAFIDSEKTESGNKITVSNDGSIGETFFQENEFLASSAITILINPQLNKYSSMFINTLIRKEKYRYSYGRKWGLEKMKKSVIKLPIDDQGKPDWKFMEDYIKTLPFSASI
ncbi:MAG: restriction endonuclease subunit S [Sulfuricurvum sp.]|nr:restriction endonuclease subunit S [Sulfuricurvum sp.]MDD5387555.1 restriction endonuclease subunit S [Sulfuricurvum sp.]